VRWLHPGEPDELLYNEFSNQRAWRQERLSHDDFVHQLPGHVALLLLVGFHYVMIRTCVIHNFNLGISQYLNGSVIATLVEKAGLWAARSLIESLKLAYADFKLWARQRGISHSQQCFTKGMLSRPSRQHFPLFKHKAWNGRVIAAWLADVSAAFLGNVVPLIGLAALASHLQAEMFALMEDMPRGLSTQQADALSAVGFALLNTYNTLAALAHDNGDMLWALKPKLHAAFHMSGT
jgi:hypothetical protein